MSYEKPQVRPLLDEPGARVIGDVTAVTFAGSPVPAAPRRPSHPWRLT